VAPPWIGKRVKVKVEVKAKSLVEDIKEQGKKPF
jgi:hypothetical protein